MAFLDRPLGVAVPGQWAQIPWVRVPGSRRVSRRRYQVCIDPTFGNKTPASFGGYGHTLSCPGRSEEAACSTATRIVAKVPFEHAMCIENFSHTAKLFTRLDVLDSVCCGLTIQYKLRLRPHP